MSKNIVLCSDGTGNTANKGRGTNVFKLFEAVDLTGSVSGQPQVAFYHDGVGTERLKYLRLFTGAVGLGLSRNVRQLYRDLVRVYDPGDAIFLFGFSRGAFTVRTLAGFIAACGILERRPNEVGLGLSWRVWRAYRTYRRRYSRLRSAIAGRTSVENRMQEWRDKHAVSHRNLAPEGRVRIRFIGVWDTVDAVGLPFDHLADLLNHIYRFKFPNRKLASTVDRACHALALDDERHSFHPVLWDETNEINGRIEQVWFAGVHSNVGGGYPKQGMSLVTLDWMMAQAEQEWNGKPGLRFLPNTRRAVRDGANVHDKLYDSRAGIAIYYRYKPRDVALMSTRNGISRPKVHISALARIVWSTADYAPGNLPSADVVTTPGRSRADAIPVFSSRELSRALDLTLADGSPLTRRKMSVAFRRVTHYLMLGLTAALAIVIIDPMSADGLTEFVTGLQEMKSISGVWAAVSSSGFRAWIEWDLLLLLSLYVLGLGTRVWMEQRFSAFWALVVPGLRERIEWRGILPQPLLDEPTRRIGS